MADEKKAAAAAAPKDPTIKSSPLAEPAEGAHPLRPLAEQTYAAANKTYRDADEGEKPDPSSVVSIEERD